jgi:hypothetical protein
MTVNSPWLLLVFALAPGSLLGEERPDFRRDVLPVLKVRCIGCHGPDVQEGRVRIDDLSTNLVEDRAAAETWHEVLNVLRAGKMPPEDETPLTEDERRTLVAWVSDAIEAAVEAGRRTNGRVVLRRLNRVEYRNTMSDLLGIEMDFARDLPPDSVSEDGFANDGGALRMSSLQLEAYLETARRALGRVVVSGPAPEVYEYEFTESNVSGWLRDTERSNRLQRMQQFLATMKTEYPEQGDFLIRARVSAELVPDAAYPLLEVSVGYRPDTKVLFDEVDVVELTSPGERVLEFRGRLEDYPLPVRGQGKFPGLVVRLRNAEDDGSPLPKAEKRDKGDAKNKGNFYPPEADRSTIVVHAVEFRAPAFDAWPPATHRRILFDSPLRATDERAYVAEVVRRFANRAYRRPATEAEVAELVDFYNEVRPTFPTFEEAIRETLAYVLIRPEFLYLVEPSGDEKRPADDWELASRLSYLLWSTMPDDRLRELAADGTLHEPDVLAAEVERLLADPRSRRFVDQFATQWLGLEVVDRVAVNPEFHPDFDNRLKVDMQEETRRFLGELLARDLSAMHLLDSDFTMLNERLARHYGIEGVRGEAFRRVALPADRRRGGLLGHASILLANSTGGDSHPVRRAVWIRDRLLGDPPAPPPPNVPTLDEADPEFLQLSVREQLEIHRNTAACSSCHAGIDPWGIALEHFDAVGLWRDDVRRQVGRKMETSPVDAADVLPDGTEIDGADALREHLLAERRDDFARTLVERMLTYALGRRLELADVATVDDLTERFAANDYRLRDLVRTIVASEPFRTK